MAYSTTRLITLLVLVCMTTVAHAGTFLSRQLRAPRVRAALQTHGHAVQQAFQDADAAWPPRDLFLRAFKHEGELEVWARSRAGSQLTRIWTLPLCATSGELGPKRHEGDGQIPEGFYTVDRFNPRSRFHLSLGLDYPNAVDRSRAGSHDPGFDIFIHGGCATIGCLPIEDDPMSRVFLAAIMARDQGQRRLPVHLFPCRFGTARCTATLAKEAHRRPSLGTFWDSLRPAFRAFETRRVVPTVRATSSGYRTR